MLPHAHPLPPLLLPLPPRSASCPDRDCASILGALYVVGEQLTESVVWEVCFEGQTWTAKAETPIDERLPYGLGGVYLRQAGSPFVPEFPVQVREVRRGWVRVSGWGRG